jgi:hypothetical protein
MLARCRNPNVESYMGYGAKGVLVCSRWSNFTLFLQDMGECHEGHTLDRFPNRHGNYEPRNCRWATPVQQAENRDSSVMVLVEGEEVCLKEAARRRGISYKTVHSRVSSGWSVEEALAIPARSGNYNGPKKAGEVNCMEC